MDASGSVDITVPYHPQRRVHIDYSPSRNNRLPHPDSDLESSIATTWDSALLRNPHLFNGTKFRVAGVTIDGNDATIHVGHTDYRTYHGTHSCKSPATVFGKKHMALVVGNVIIVETLDGMAAMILRSGKVGEGNGALAFVGGHPEPDEIQNLKEGDHEKVKEEFWKGAWREVLEELFIDEEKLGPFQDMTWLGLLERTSDKKVNIVFHAKVKLQSKQLKEIWRKGNGEEEESTALYLVPMHKLRDIAEGKSIDGKPAVAELNGAAQLWVQMMDYGKSP